MDTVSITCPKCGLTSHHPDDIAAKYCGNCHQYHDMMPAMAKAQRLNKREVCTIYDVPPWLIAPGEQGERWWWYRTWPRRKWRLAWHAVKRWAR